MTLHHAGRSVQDTAAALWPSSSARRPSGAGGAARATVTSKVCTAARWGRDVSSFAVTVMMEPPAAAPRTVKVSEPEPTWETVATSAREVVTAYVRASPSGSLKAPARDTRAVAPMSRSKFSRARPTSGGRFAGGDSTVTSKVCTAGRPAPSWPSVAPTVTVAVPGATAVTVNVPDAIPDTVATSDRLVLGATYVRGSPSGSSNVPPRSTVCIWPV